jgi:hypothetical protein
MGERWHQPTIGLFTPGEWEHFEASLRQWLMGEPVGAGEVLIDEALLAPSAYTYAQSVHRWMNLLGMPELAERINLNDFRERDPFLAPPKNTPARQHRTP